MTRRVRLVLPHQLFEEQLEAAEGTLFILLEDDLFFRQYRFHKQKLVLHRASMKHFAGSVAKAGFAVEYLETTPETSSQSGLLALLQQQGATQCSYYDVVDDWLQQRLQETLDRAGVEHGVLETVNFLTTDEQLRQYFARRAWRMQNFYEWQRKRLGVLLDDGRQPVGGKWSFDTENRKKLPKDLPVPAMPEFGPDDEIAKAVRWVNSEFADNPGNAEHFNWPVTGKQASEALQAFLAERFELFGPYEDAIAMKHGFLFHSALSSSLNIGLLNPQAVLDIVLDAAVRHNVPLASVEGYVRQLIGWREYMRAAYVLRGRQMRTHNELQFTGDLSGGWWTAETGLLPVDTVIGRILETCYAHHIERLMVLGNAMQLLRIKPDAVYQWFMEMFIDSYDWVMVPNVYAMSQYAAGNLITTKPYVSGSNYLKKMSDFPSGDWTAAWDGLYWQFVDDHRDLFSSNPRSNMMVRMFDDFDAVKKRRLRGEAEKWVGGHSQ